MSQQTPHVVRIGVYMPSGAQLLDMACIDVLHMMSREYLGNLAMIPAHVAAVAPSVRIFYITSSPAMTAGRIPLTASAALIPTHDLADSEVGPGELDVVLVPGADPAEEFGEEVTGWLKRQMEEGGADVLCVCTGVYLCGRSGLLEGRRVCGPRGLQADLRKRWPGAEFVGDRLRWTRDGRFWSCGGITNGNELVTAYARESSHFPGPVVEMGAMMAEVGVLPQEYEQGTARFTAGVVWQILRAFFAGPGSKPKTV